MALVHVYLILYFSQEATIWFIDSCNLSPPHYNLQTFGFSILGRWEVHISPYRTQKTLDDLGLCPLRSKHDIWSAEKWFRFFFLNTCPSALEPTLNETFDSLEQMDPVSSSSQIALAERCEQIGPMRQWAQIALACQSWYSMRRDTFTEKQNLLSYTAS